MAPCYFFKGTETATCDGLVGVAVLDVVVASEDAVLATDDAGDEVAIAVGISHSLTVDDGLCLSREIRPHGIGGGFDLVDFIEGYGCSGIALDTADALALG